MNLFSSGNKIVLFIAILALSPFFVFAQTGSQTCSPTGYTIETVNGVFTDEAGAVVNKKALEYFLPGTYNGEPVTVDYLLNPSHLAGLGDVVVATYQKIFDSETVRDYDLTEMLKSASEKVKTKKLLLVAHSQGNFYANSFYDSVTGAGGGMSENTIGVYSIATPSGRVAGNGKWLTSDTDKVIAGAVVAVLGRNIMKPNIHIALGASDDQLGHNLSDVYLKHESGKIVSDIEESLGKLKYYNNVDDTNRPCITPPKLTLSHKIGGALLAVADPVANTTANGAGAVGKSAYQTGLAVGGLVKQTAIGTAYAVGVVANVAYKTGVAMVVSTEKTILAISSATKQVGLALGASVFSSTSAEQTKTEIVSPQNTVISSIVQNILDTTPKEILIPEQNQPNPPNLGAELPKTTDSAHLEVQPPSGEGQVSIAVPPKDMVKNATPDNPVGSISTPQINFGLSLGFGGGGGGMPAPTNNSQPQVAEQNSLQGGQITNNEITDSIDSETATTSDSATETSTIATSTTSVPCDDSLATNFGGALPCVYPPPPPSKPTIISPSDFSVPFATTTLTFIGTSSPSFIISNSLTSATTTTDDSGDWTLVFSNLSEGATTVNFVATRPADSTGSLEATSSPRSISFSISLPPSRPAITSPSDLSQTFYTTSLTFAGTSSPGFVISNDFSSTTVITDGSGDWSVELVNLTEATRIIKFYATNSTGLISDANAVSVITSAPLMTHCLNAFTSSGYYFDDFQSSEYVNGFLTLHFKVKMPNNDGHQWISRISVFTDQCGSGTVEIFPGFVTMPQGTQTWSVRFTSLTHFDIWSDDTNTMMTCADCSQNITLFPSYYEITFFGSIDNGVSQIRSSAHRIMENAPNAPVKSFNTPIIPGCPISWAGNYFFDSYEHVRYVNGLLNYHFRFKPAYNNGRIFYSKLRLYDSECRGIGETNAFTTANVVLPAYVRYWSLRFSSPTHYDIWNDESETMAVCPRCSVDIPATFSNGSPYSYVSFAGMIDPGAGERLESTPYRINNN